MRNYESLPRVQRRIFAARAAGQLSGGVVRAATMAVGAVRHAMWYATYLIDGRRGTRE